MQLEPESVVFEAQGDPVQAAILLSAILLPFGYWWYITVPEARINLAKDKRLDGGGTKAFLDELAASDEARPVERWFFAKWLTQRKPARAKPPAASAEASVEPEAAPAPVPPTSPQQMPLTELFRPASLKNNATPNFWSGDNPIVVTMGLLALLGTFASVARSNSALAIDGAILAAGLTFGLSRLTLD